MSITYSHDASHFLQKQPIFVVDLRKSIFRNGIFLCLGSKVIWHNWTLVIYIALDVFKLT